MCGSVADVASDDSDDECCTVTTPADSAFDVTSSCVTPTISSNVIKRPQSDSRLADVECYLELKELWDKFHQLGTEMIITKSGRYTPKFIRFLVFITRLVKK